MRLSRNVRFLVGSLLVAAMLHSADAAPIMQDGVESLLQESGGAMPSAAGYKEVMAGIPKSILALAQGKAAQVGEGKGEAEKAPPHESRAEAQNNIQASMEKAVNKAAAETAARAAADQAAAPPAKAMAEAKAAADELHKAASKGKKASVKPAEKDPKAAADELHKAANVKVEKAPVKPAKKDHPASKKVATGGKAADTEAAPPSKRAEPKEAALEKTAAARKAAPVKDAPKKAAPVKAAPKPEDAKKAALLDKIESDFDAVEGTKGGEAPKKKKAAASNAAKKTPKLDSRTEEKLGVEAVETHKMKKGQNEGVYHDKEPTKNPAQNKAGPKTNRPSAQKADPVAKKAPAKVARRGHINSHKPVETPTKKNEAKPPTISKALKVAKQIKNAAKEPKKAAKKPERAAMESKKAAKQPKKALGETMKVPKIDLSQFEHKSNAMKTMEKLASTMGLHEKFDTTVAPVAPTKAKVDKTVQKKEAAKEAVWMQDFKKNGESMSKGIKLPPLKVSVGKLDYDHVLKPMKQIVLMPESVNKLGKALKKMERAPKLKSEKEESKELGEEVAETNKEVLQDLKPVTKDPLFPVGKLTFGGAALDIPKFNLHKVGANEELIQEESGDPSEDESQSRDDEDEDGTQEDTVAASQPFFHHKHKPLFKHYRFAKKSAAAEHGPAHHHEDLGEAAEVVTKPSRPEPSYNKVTEDKPFEEYDPIQDMLDANGWDRSRLMSPDQVNKMMDREHEGMDDEEHGDLGESDDVNADDDKEEDDKEDDDKEDDDKEDEHGDLGESSDMDHDDKDGDEDEEDESGLPVSMVAKVAKVAKAKVVAPVAAKTLPEIANEGEISEEDEHNDLGESGPVTVAPIDMEKANVVHTNAEMDDAAGDETAAGDAEKNLKAGDHNDW